jgi:hypothetical protein
MIFAIATSFTFLLTGCEEGNTEIRKNINQISNVDGFKDCVSYIGRVSGYPSIIIRCPNSSVSATLASKNRVFTNTIDENTVNDENILKAQRELQTRKEIAEHALKALQKAQSEYENMIRK